MWTPLQNSLGGSNSPRVEITPKDRPEALLEDIGASLTWFDRFLLRVGLRWLRRIAITIVGVTVVLLGIIMIVAPGPAFIVLPLGLGILGLEYAWARTLLRRIKRYVDAGIAQGAAVLGRSQEGGGARGAASPDPCEVPQGADEADQAPTSDAPGTESS